jgi:hypothetical protein
MRKGLVSILGLILLVGCSKEPGEGGKNTIEGVVIMQEYTESTDQFIIEYPASEERVYIIYGDNAYYADETRTNYDGSFHYEYLYKGDYTIFIYSECLAYPGGAEPLFIDIELKERKEEFVTDTLYIKKYIK